MRKIKVITVVGTRPEIIRLSRVIEKLDNFCEHTLVHSGQNYDYELNQIFFEELGIRKPDYFLNSAEGSKSAVNTIGNLISSVDDILALVKPDAMLVLGDTNSGLAVIPAKRRKIPIFHMEAGNRCYDLRVPEEINRRIIDHTSDINLTYSTIAREYLLKEGFPADQVIKTGSPMHEVLDFYKEKIEKSNILEKLDLKKGQYFVISAHREENVDSDKQFDKLINIVESLADLYHCPVVFSAHPRTKNRLEAKGAQFNPLVKLSKPFGFIDYVCLQKNAKVVISDSGTITEESSILNFPAVNLREAHERPEGMEEAAVMMVGLNFERLVQAINILENKPDCHHKIVDDYSTKNVSDKVLKLIHSYTDYVNRVVWKKY